MTRSPAPSKGLDGAGPTTVSCTKLVLWNHEARTLNISGYVQSGDDTCLGGLDDFGALCRLGLALVH